MGAGKQVPMPERRGACPIALLQPAVVVGKEPCGCRGSGLCGCRDHGGCSQRCLVTLGVPLWACAGMMMQMLFVCSSPAERS